MRIFKIIVGSGLFTFMMYLGFKMILEDLSYRYGNGSGIPIVQYVKDMGLNFFVMFVVVMIVGLLWSNEKKIEK